MKGTKRLLAVVLALLLCAGSAAFAQETEGSVMPICTDGSITLKVYGSRYSTHAEWAEMESWKELQRRSGIKLEFETAPDDQIVEKRNLKLASNDLPDVFFATGFTPTDLTVYGADGAFLPLEDLIDECCPNLKAILDRDEYKAVRAGMTMPDGHIYSLPTIYEAEYYSMICNERFLIKKDWLAALGMNMPQTTEEFYQYLVGVRDNDVNGNGDPHDERGLIGNSKITRFVRVLNGSWGLQRWGNSHLYVDDDPETGELRFFKIDPRYKEVLQYLNRLYSEGLIEPEIFTLDASSATDRGTTGLYGAICMMSGTMYNQDDYIGVDMLAGPYGDKLWSNAAPNLTRSGGLVLTTSNPYPKETLKLFDYYCYSPEGLQLYMLGLEGKQWEYDENGVEQYMDWVLNNPDGLTLDEAVSTFTCWPLAGKYPAFINQRYSRSARKAADAVEAASRLYPYFVDALPAFTYTLEEAEAMQVYADILTYVDSMTNKFVSGAETFDNWDQYVKTVRSMGLDGYMKIYNDAYERFKLAMQ